jgi:hypothetical protein
MSISNCIKDFSIGYIVSYGKGSYSAYGYVVMYYTSENQIVDNPRTRCWRFGMWLGTKLQ